MIDKYKLVMMKVVRIYQLFLFFLYISIFRHTPEDYRPYAFIFPFIRKALVERFVKKCGKNVRVKSGADISPLICIGEDSELGTRCLIQSNVTIGNNVIMGPDVKIYSKNHRYDSLDIPIQKQGEVSYKTIIGNDVWIGANVIILPNKKIGNHTLISAGTVVTKNVPDFAVVGGNPGKIIKYRNSDNIAGEELPYRESVREKIIL